jgi:hypothetical protein
VGNGDQRMTDSRVTPRKVRPVISLQTLNRCAELWASQTISPTSDGFLEVATMLDQGRSELLAAIEDATDEASP